MPWCLVLLEAQRDRPRAAGRVFARPRPIDEPAPTLTHSAVSAEWRWVDDVELRAGPADTDTC